MPDLGSLAQLAAHEAVPVLVDRYGAKLLRLGIKVCGDEEEAADLLQEIFLAAFRKWDQFEGRSEPTSWLYTIAVRACQRKHRRRSGEPNRIASLDELLPEPGPTVPFVAPPDDPEADLLRREAVEQVDQAIATLPMAYRIPLVLKEMAELSVAEIAEILGLKEATVKTRLHRARLHLRHALESSLPRTEVPIPDHERQMCLDLLQAKQEALDRGVPFPVAPANLCTRCRSFFDTLDLASNVCQDLREGELPPALRQLVLARLDAAAGSR